MKTAHDRLKEAFSQTEHDIGVDGILREVSAYCVERAEDCNGTDPSAERDYRKAAIRIGKWAQTVFAPLLLALAVLGCDLSATSPTGTTTNASTSILGTWTNGAKWYVEIGDGRFTAYRERDGERPFSYSGTLEIAGDSLYASQVVLTARGFDGPIKVRKVDQDVAYGYTLSRDSLAISGQGILIGTYGR